MLVDSVAVTTLRVCWEQRNRPFLYGNFSDFTVHDSRKVRKTRSDTRSTLASRHETAARTFIQPIPPAARDGPHADEGERGPGAARRTRADPLRGAPPLPVPPSRRQEHGQGQAALVPSHPGGARQHAHPAQAERAQARARVEVPRPRRRAQPQAQVSANVRPARRAEASTGVGRRRRSFVVHRAGRRETEDSGSLVAGGGQDADEGATRAALAAAAVPPRGVRREHGGDAAERVPPAQAREPVPRVEGLSARQRGQRTARGWTRAVGQTTGGVRPSSPEPGANHRRDGQVRQYRRPEDPDRRSVQRHRAVDLLRSGRPQATGAPRLPRPLLLREVVRRVRGDGRDDATRGDRLRDRVPVEATEGALVAAREGAGRVVGGQQAHEALARPHAPDGASGSVR